MSFFGPSFGSFLETLGVSKLQEHGHVILLSAFAWQLVYMLTYRIYERLQPTFYLKLSAVKKLDWAMHHVSFLHAFLIFLLSVPMLTDEALVNDKLFGYSYYGSTVLAITTGYFLWDTLICLSFMHLHGPGFAFHAIACFIIYLLSFKPIFQYFGGVFLAYELSTPLLNIHWFCDKTGNTGSLVQIVNGFVLLAVFFFVRLVFGYHQSYIFFGLVWERYADIPKHLIVIYGTANILLNGLNAFWFYKMIRSVRSRLRGEEVSDDRGGRVSPSKKQK